MNPFEMPEENDEVRDFSAFADAIADGDSPIPENELEATFLRVQSALGSVSMAASAMPGQDRALLQEKRMNTNIAPTIASLPMVPAGSGSVNKGGRDFVGRNMDRWQAAVSMAAVIALLVGMSAFLYQNQFRNDSSGPSPSSPASFGQTIYNGDEGSYLMAPEECVANGPIVEDSYYLDKSINDLTRPQYYPAQPVSPEIQQRVFDTSAAYLRCIQELTPSGTPMVNEPIDPILLTYGSDRLRIIELLNQANPSSMLTGEQRREIRDYVCQSQNQASVILANFPLPVNQPLDFISLARPGEDPLSDMTTGFAPSDVYRLPDGRYAAVAGTIAYETMSNPTNGNKTDYAAFFAFVERDGRFYIDEVIVLVQSGQLQLAPASGCPLPEAPEASPAS